MGLELNPKQVGGYTYTQHNIICLNKQSSVNDHASCLIEPLGGGETMRKKNGFAVFSTVFLLVALFSTAFVYAQLSFAWCRVLAYGTSFIENEFEGGSVRFRVVSPPEGSGIPNEIYAMYEFGGENMTTSLSPGDNVLVTYTGNLVSIITNYTEASEPDHFIINYEGEAGWLQVNGVQIPEFSPILIVPMFTVATLIALVYRRKRTSKSKKKD